MRAGGGDLGDLLRTGTAALAASRPMISTELPPASARSARALAMFPRPMMLILLMKSPVLVKPERLITQP
jgi:hypothetical protein